MSLTFLLLVRLQFPLTFFPLNRLPFLKLLKPLLQCRNIHAIFFGHRLRPFYIVHVWMLGWWQSFLFYRLIVLLIKTFLQISNIQKIVPVSVWLLSGWCSLLYFGFMDEIVFNGLVHTLDSLDFTLFRIMRVEVVIIVLSGSDLFWLDFPEDVIFSFFRIPWLGKGHGSVVMGLWRPLPISRLLPS